MTTVEMEKCVICHRPIKDDRVMATVLVAGEEATRPAHGKCLDRKRRQLDDWERKVAREAARKAKTR